MKAYEIAKYIEKTYPLNSQMSFDNSGPIIYNGDDEVSGVLVCLDVTMSAIEFAITNGINLIISHHPMIFNEIKSINNDVLSKRIKALIKNSINTYSVHTNFDVNLKCGMGKILTNKLFDKSLIRSEDILEKYIVSRKKYGIGNIIKLKSFVDFNSILNILKDGIALRDSEISYYNFNTMPISKIILIPGSGSGEIDLVINEKPDLLITSDLKHNHIIDLLDSNISYINASHYGLEKVFIEYMSKFVMKKFKNVYTYYETLL